MFQRLFYTVAPVIIVLALALMMSTNEINTPLSYEKGAPVQVSVVEVNKSDNSDGVIINFNQAVNFNHISQLFVDYIFIALLTIFFVLVVNYRHFKPVILLPPWYIILKYSSRLSVSGWKVSNLLYKSKLLFQF